MQFWPGNALAVNSASAGDPLTLTLKWYRGEVTESCVCAAEDVLTTTESQAQKTETHPQLTQEANAGAADAGLRIHTQGDRDMDTLLATELTDTSLQQWIFKRTVRVVDEITGTNFAYYESLRLPMLLLFVDKGQDNARVLADFKAVAKAYQGKVSFAYIDGKAHAARKVALGLVDDLLPALAFNTLSGALYPFPTHRALTQAHIKEHVEGFLSGRLHPTQASSSQQEVTAAQDEAERLGAHGLIEISHKSFQQVLDSLRPPRVRHPIPFAPMLAKASPLPALEILCPDTCHAIAQVCMDETRDVLVLFYSAAAQVTKDFWPYWRKTVERFGQLNVTSLKIGRYDVTRNQLPIAVEIDSLPAIVMFPAKDKAPPLKLFHGKAKVRPIMEWARQVASIPFEFPNDTPHLDDEQRKAYLVQVAWRFTPSAPLAPLPPYSPHDDDDSYHSERLRPLRVPPPARPATSGKAPPKFSDTKVPLTISGEGAG